MLDTKYDGWLVVYKGVRPSGRPGNQSKTFPTRAEAEKFVETLGDNLVLFNQYVDAPETSHYFK